MRLVIISGPEATGKTAIGKEVAKLLGYEYRSKDAIKEKLFDTAKHNTWDYGWYERKAKRDFFGVINGLARSGTDSVIESNFIGKDKAQLSKFLNDEVVMVEIYCTAKGMTTFRRFVRRNESGKRHKAHHDRRWYAKIFLEDLLRYAHVNWPSGPSGLTRKLLIVDTTDFSKIDYQGIADFIKQA